MPRLLGAPGSGARAYLARSLLSGRWTLPGFPAGTQESLVLLARDQEEAEDTADAFQALGPLFGGDPAACALLGDDEPARLAALEQVRSGARLLVCTPAAPGAALPRPAEFSDQSLILKPGCASSRERVLEGLAQAGYQRVDYVESPGEFAARGAVVDFYGLEPLRAVRLLFDEASLVSIRTFEPSSQATLEFLSEAKAVPAGGGQAVATGTLLDWVGEQALWIVPEGLECAIAPAARTWRLGPGPALPGDLDFGALAQRSGGGHAGSFDEMARLAAQGARVILFSLNHGEDQRVQELLEERGGAGTVQFLVGPLRRGFRLPCQGLSVYSTSEIFERRYRRASGWKYFTTSYKGALRWRELRHGDYVVHQDYGIARYRGLKPVESPGHGVLDCLLLEFRGADRLYIPMSEFGRVQKYSGAEGRRPRLSSLDTRRWEEIKRRVREDVRQLAEELLKTQAERAARPGHAFSPQTPMEREFAEAFPYEETPDQAAAIRDVLGDMMSPHPMDRLVIGDVGFGKTEVAMRAAFKCAAGYKQAAVLVPTTILADQHYRTFTRRMAGYPVRLELLTRFQAAARQREILSGLREGRVDVVIGTARLLQKDVSFKDLGLVVIDEEHRFGVKDKEGLKRLRARVDFLALSATPIPRTLNQALSGLRGMSLIESPPAGRQPIVTKVGPWDEAAVVAAISEELSRGGQAYYVHNRVRSMEDTVARLKRLLPRARFGMVHGQMRAQQLEEAMWRFFNREFDVLVASTIIESGLDIPSVNTLLVEDAQDFGLAQLYQLRGRIGREQQRACCYLFFPEGHEDASLLSEDARKRLEALKEFGALGAGIRLALRDLEIRGAGELLGARQHGLINAVGAEFYSQMLDEEVTSRQGRAKPPERRLRLDLPLQAFIPEAYLPDESRRLDFYKKILRAGENDAQSISRELEDLCGPLPQPARNLLRLIPLRAAAIRSGICSISQSGRLLTILFSEGAPIEPSAPARWSQAYKGRLRFLHGPEGDGVEAGLDPGEDAVAWLEGFLAV